MDSEDKVRLDVFFSDSNGWSVRLNVPGHGPGGKNPYDACKGKTLEEAPRFVAAQYNLQPNPHSICSLMACEAAVGIAPSKRETIRRSLVLYGIALREHGLHLVGCIDAGMLEGGERERGILRGYAEDIACGGQMLAMENSADECPKESPVFPGVTRAERFLLDCRDGAVALARSFVSIRFSVNRFPVHVVKSGTRWAESGTSLEVLKSTDKHPVELDRQGIDVLGRGVDARRPTMVGPPSRLLRAKSTLCSSENRTGHDIAFALERLPNSNMFLNLMAIAAECVVLIDRVAEDIAAMSGDPRPSASRGTSEEAIAVIEAPRGLLIHEVHAKDGRVVSGRVLTPTRINLNMMERSLACGAWRRREMRAKVIRDTFERNASWILRALYPCVELADGSLQFVWHESP